MIQGMYINESVSLSGLHCVEEMHTTGRKARHFSHCAFLLFLLSPFLFQFFSFSFFFNLSHSLFSLFFLFLLFSLLLSLSLDLSLIHSFSCLFSHSLTHSPWGFIWEGRKKNLSSLKNEVFLTETLSVVFSMSTSSKLWRSLIRRKTSLKMIWTYLLGVHSSNTQIKCTRE